MWVGAVARPSLSPVVCGDVVIYYESNNGVSKGDWIYVRLRLNGVKVLTVLGWTRKLKIKRHETMIRSSRLFPLINCSLNRSLYEVCSFISLFFLCFSPFILSSFGAWFSNEDIGRLGVSRFKLMHVLFQLLGGRWVLTKRPSDNALELLYPPSFFAFILSFFYNLRVSWIVNLSDSNRNRCIGSRISFIYSIRLRDPPQSFVLLSFLLFFFWACIGRFIWLFLVLFFSCREFRLYWMSAIIRQFGPIRPTAMTDDDGWLRRISVTFALGETDSSQ